MDAPAPRLSCGRCRPCRPAAGRGPGRGAGGPGPACARPARSSAPAGRRAGAGQRPSGPRRLPCPSGRQYQPFPRLSRKFFLILLPVEKLHVRFPVRGAGRLFSNPQAGTASVWPGAAAAALRSPSLRCGPRAPSLRPGPCCNAWMPGRRASSVPPWRMMRTAWTPRCGIFARPKPRGGAAKVIWPCCPVVWSRRPACVGPWIWRSAVWSVCWMPRPLMPPAGPGSGPCTAGRASPAVLSPANCAGAFLCPSPLCPTV